MSLVKKAVSNGSWFALFKALSQAVSWAVTIAVARILLPADYALAAMATMITGYAEMLSEMGIGASIIQRDEPTERDLSSVFWLSLGVGVVFAAACFPVAYLTAHIFDQPQVVPLVQAISVLFIFTGLQVVPMSLLKRNLEYKTVGIIQIQTTVIGCMAMLAIAYNGGGVWTLVGGRIVLGFAKLILVYRATTWRPKVYFNFSEAKEYLRFGVIVAISSSFFYIFEMSDRFFAGRAWELEVLGYYLLAMQLAQMPTDKIATTINQVSYALFSRYQDDMDKFRSSYLTTIKYTALLVFPIFVFGFLLGEELVFLLLGEKWMPIVFLFEFLCLSQIITTLNAVVNFAHMALGYPKRGVCYSASCAVFMSISFYFAVQYETNAILIPWFTTYLAISIVWLTYTNIKLGIGGGQYLATLRSPVLGVLALSLAVYILKSLSTLYQVDVIIMLPVTVAISSACYLLFLWIFDRNIWTFIQEFRAS
ncbi:lipopolysaccharide biosynthesis protein [Oceanicoccus sp. KOV_DT_Chl]|uniref:lipopolysaccharide biosynthesis protein n=1 Tax=Oceanicoccus sp. KOV_DT_Chl TaxID=1904639 RepID=UPI001357FD24|nr:lipopolysaccharide biosynthesis protein [Oceanicoccus sp. KOV_DT_Chl]